MSAILLLPRAGEVLSVAGTLGYFTLSSDVRLRNRAGLLRGCSLLTIFIVNRCWARSQYSCARPSGQPSASQRWYARSRIRCSQSRIFSCELSDIDNSVTTFGQRTTMTEAASGCTSRNRAWLRCAVFLSTLVTWFPFPTSAREVARYRPTPMWFGTKSTICLSPLVFRAATIRSNAASPPNSGFNALWSTIS